MTPDFYQSNAGVLEEELRWFEDVLDERIRSYFDPEKFPRPRLIPPPEYGEAAKDIPYIKMLRHYKLASEERLILALALTPEVRPHKLDIFFTKNKDFDRGFSEFGGILGKRHGGFLPTLETALFLLSGQDLAQRMACQTIFDSGHIFKKFRILDMDVENDKDPLAATPLRLTRETLDFLLHGRLKEPDFSEQFPAKKIETRMEWKDLVLAPHTLEQLTEMRAWLEHGDALLNEWKLGKRLRPGYCCLFYGPPGTGKTLTAGLLGKLAGRSVYRVDLSQVVSKYIGETEKNLERVFQKAQNQNWILFFDEADSLFGKRTEVSDAHDRYANQGTSYLLQRIEDCPNLVILSSNLKSNIDDAFVRRFQSMVYFPMPQKKERLKLWQKGFSPVSTLAGDINMDEIAEEYILAGGSIVNVIRYCSLMALKKGTTEISSYDLKAGLQREYIKEGKTG